MPELPEVETIARTLSPQIKDRVIDAVHVLLPKTLAAGNDLLAEVFPARILGVRRRGKLLLLDVDGGYVLAFHLKMTGRLFVHGENEAPGKHTKVVFDIAAEPGKPAARLFFDDARTFGFCRLMRPEDLPAWPFWKKLGPEPLTLGKDAFITAFKGRRGAIKALLLDQAMVAGIGNIYADEACFRTGIRPDSPACALSDALLAALLENVQAVLTESIAECGSSIRDYRDANGDAGAFQNLFRVYGRAGQPCLTCGTTLEKKTVAGRTTVFCPHCQKQVAINPIPALRGSGPNR
ncbi:MAG: Formamidopyrimidine-DNA glycosylase [Desulfovibrio sp.]